MKSRLYNLIVVFILLFLTNTLGVTFAQTNLDLSNLENSDPDLTKAYDKISIFDTWSLINKFNAQVTPVTIGIVDTGIDAGHPEFNGVNFGRSSPFSLRDHAVDDELPGGHGTQTAGVIGANNLSASTLYDFPQMNGIVSGMAGLNYTLESRTKSVLLLTNTSIGITLDSIPENSIVALNVSSYKCSEMPASFKLFFDCVKDEDFQEISNWYKETIANNQDSLYVIAGGNAGISSEFTTPANADLGNSVVIGATSLEDGRANFIVGSSDFGFRIAVAAPGEKIYAPAIRGKGDFPISGEETGNYITNFGGTSGATPLVTGVAAILKALEPEYQKYTTGLVMNPVTIKDTLIKSADPIATGEPDRPLGKDCYNYNPNPPDDHTGCRLNAHRAVAWFFQPEAVEELRTTTTTLNSIALEWSLPVDFDFQNPDFDSYRIFRNDTLVATIKDSSQLSFTDTNLPSNTTFFYKLFVFDKAGLSTGSNEVSADTLSGEHLLISFPPSQFADTIAFGVVGQEKIAQSFKLAQPSRISRVSVIIWKGFAAGDGVRARLSTDLNDTLATSNIVPAFVLGTTVTTDTTSFTFPPSEQPTLPANQTLFFILERTGPLTFIPTDSFFVNLRAGGFGATYPDGMFHFFNNFIGQWVNQLDFDFFFEVFGF